MAPATVAAPSIPQRASRIPAMQPLNLPHRINRNRARTSMTPMQAAALSTPSPRASRSINCPWAPPRRGGGGARRYTSPTRVVRRGAYRAAARRLSRAHAAHRGLRDATEGDVSNRDNGGTSNENGDRNAEAINSFADFRHPTETPLPPFVIVNGYDSALSPFADVQRSIGYPLPPLGSGIGYALAPFAHLNFTHTPRIVLSPIDHESINLFTNTNKQMISTSQPAPEAPRTLLLAWDALPEKHETPSLGAGQQHLEGDDSNKVDEAEMTEDEEVLAVMDQVDAWWESIHGPANAKGQFEEERGFEEEGTRPGGGEASA